MDYNNYLSIMKQLKSAIAEIQSEINLQIESINNGGCGWFAYYMTSTLKKLGIDAEIRLINREGRSVQKNKVLLNNYRNGNDYDPSSLGETSFIHCYIRVGRIYFDAIDSTLPQLKYRYDCYNFEGNYTLEELETALEVGCWNPNYDKDNNSLLKDIIEGNLIKLYENGQLHREGA